MTGQEIKKLRLSYGLSQRQFAKRLGVKRQTVARWESSLRTPSKEIIAELEQLSRKNVAGESVASEGVAGESVAGESVARESVARENVARENVARENVARENVANENVTDPNGLGRGAILIGLPPQTYYETMYKNAKGVISLCTITQPKDSEKGSSLQVKGFYEISQIPDLIAEANKLNGLFHIYTGIHPLRERPDKGRGKEKDILGVALYAADVDAKDFIEDKIERQKANKERAFYKWTDGLLSECKAKALAHINSVCDKVSLPPTAIIDSGHGYYPIFKLDKFIEFENSKHREELKNVNKALHEAFAADSTFDFARILRVPGTRNIKPGYPADCELVELHPDRRYTLDDIRKFEKLETSPDVGLSPTITTKPEQTKQKTQTKMQTVSLDDTRGHVLALIEKAKNAKDGAKFTALWNGNISGYKSQSEADLALCCLLAFWTGGDRSRIDSLFRQSGLCRDKWKDREDYREKTINAALTHTTEFYDPNAVTSLTSPSAKKSQKSEQHRANTQDILSEISLLDEPTPEKIQTKLWDFVIDASYWTPAELGRFCDKLNIEYSVTKTWLRGWKRAVITEKRKRSAKAQSRFSATNAGEKPTIVVSNRFMREITDDIIAAINQVNTPKPFIFVRSSLPTRVELDENGNAIAKPLTVAAARGIMERAANFMSETDIEGETLQTPVNPPLDNVNDFLSLGSFPDLPPLVGISTAPVVAPDGTICMEEGYQPSVRYFYHAKEKLEIGDIIPTPENVEKAKRLILDELYCDFPFADQASRANTIALMLTPFVRPLIQGATPLHTIDASTPGTGKTLLADIASMPFISSGPTIMTAGRDDDEWRKRITAKLMNAPSHILIDNVKNKLTSGDLSAALTAHEWEDRILGQSATIRLPVKCTWIATGNNLELSDEIVRRSVWIRLEANVERPWERRGFKHENLRGWVQKHRGELVTALLTLVQRWLADGKPEENDVILGGYEEWVKVIGGILKATGIDGFLENATMLYEQLDVERQAWVEFFSAWAEQYGAYDEESSSWGAYVETDSGARVWEKRNDGGPVGTKELFPLASHFDDTPNEGLGILDAYLGRGKERARKTNLGRQLQKRKGRIFGGYRLAILSTKRKHATLYQLTRCYR